MKAGGRKIHEKKIKQKEVIKVKPVKNIKVKKAKESKRPEVLEREIKRDIKELQEILDSEKKLGKKIKKVSLDNN